MFHKKSQGYWTLTTKSTALACDSDIAIVAYSRSVNMHGDKDGIFDKITPWSANTLELQEWLNG